MRQEKQLKPAFPLAFLVLDYDHESVEQAEVFGQVAVYDNTFDESTASEENQSINSIPESYLEFGITVDKDTAAWRYKTKTITALYDHEGRIYTNDRVPAGQAVYIEVLRKQNRRIQEVREITKEQMQGLFDEMSYHDEMPGALNAVSM